MALQRKQISADNARMRLEELCVRSEHCSYELREKLKRWGVPSGESEKILEALRKARFYDDLRFARAYVRDKLLYNRWGRRKIAVGLMSKRIDRDVADEAMDEIEEEDYRRILLELATAKARGIKEGDSFEGRTRLFRFLASRGFEAGMISDVTRNPSVWGEEEEE